MATAGANKTLEALAKIFSVVRQGSPELDEGLTMSSV